jgi:uncharacterized protein (DUF924 family)
MRTANDVLAFWLDEVGQTGWYESDARVDARIREEFLTTWQEARDGAGGLWLTSARETLAYLILTDQFSRNMFRGHADSFAMDKSARAASKHAIDRGWDMKVAEPERQFFYMPLVHSENLCDQERAVRLIKDRMPEGAASQLLHAKAHRRIIRDFGRFPFRNEALGRKSTAAEAVFIENGGYGAVIRDLQAA